MNPYLFPSLELGPSAVERLLRVIPESEFDRSLNPDRFTVREVVAHLADWEPVYRKRMEDIRANPGIEVTVFDEEQRAIDGDYRSQDVWECLANWRMERKKTAALIRTFTEADMDLPFRHPVSGAMRLGDLANMLAGHDLYHVEQLTQYLNEA